MDEYAHGVYRATKTFPKEELFGVTSQIRRSSLSVVLNYVEGYARRKGDKCKVYQNFMEIAYGSLKESKYLLNFCLVEGYINNDQFEQLNSMADQIGAMLYKIT